jgi:hypothetical protein
MYVKVTIGIVKVDGFGNETLLGSKVTLIAPDYTYSFAPASTYTTTLNPTAPDNNYCSQVGVLLNTIVPVPRNAPNPPNRLRVDVADVDLFNGNTIKVIVAAKVKELAKSFTQQTVMLIMEC